MGLMDQVKQAEGTIRRLIREEIADEPSIQNTQTEAFGKITSVGDDGSLGAKLNGDTTETVGLLNPKGIALAVDDEVLVRVRGHDRYVELKLGDVFKPARDKQVTATGSVEVARCESRTGGNYCVYVFLRVANATATTSATVTYTDVTGTSRSVAIAASLSRAVGAYTFAPLLVNVAPGSSIVVTGTTSIANNLYVSASFESK